MERAEVWLDDPSVGDLPVRVGALSVSESRAHRVVRFRYHRHWLAHENGGLALDPELPLSEGDDHALEVRRRRRRK